MYCLKFCFSADENKIKNMSLPPRFGVRPSASLKSYRNNTVPLYATVKQCALTVINWNYCLQQTIKGDDTNIEKCVHDKIIRIKYSATVPLSPSHYFVFRCERWNVFMNFCIEWFMTRDHKEFNMCEVNCFGFNEIKFKLWGNKTKW